MIPSQDVVGGPEQSAVPDSPSAAPSPETSRHVIVLPSAPQQPTSTASAPLRGIAPVPSRTVPPLSTDRTTSSAATVGVTSGVIVGVAAGSWEVLRTAGRDEHPVTRAPTAARVARRRSARLDTPAFSVSRPNGGVEAAMADGRLSWSAVPVVVRPLEAFDLPAVLAMNNAAVPAVPPATLHELGELVTVASLAVVAETEPGHPTGFLLAMDPGVDYASENYRWFAARGDSFVYVDRIVVADGRRGGGIGRALYDAAFARAREFGRAEVDCEVNVRPENPASLAFHARLGFEKLGEQETKGGAYRVALLAAPVA